MDQRHYKSIVAIARQIYDKIMQSPNPRKCTLRDLPGDFLRLSAITNRWLVFQNIKAAAINGDFSLFRANCRADLDEARKWKIWQSSSRPSACDTTIEIRTGASQMDVEHGLRTVPEKFIKHTLIKSHGPIELVGHNPRAASGFTDVYSVWLKCQVRERVSVLSLDIGTGFQIFRRRFTEIQAHLEGCAPRLAEGQVAQRL
jgi:hypothetical protein